MRRFRAAVGFLACVCLPARASETVWKSSDGLKFPPSALAADLDLDGILDAVVVGQENRVVAYGVARRAKLWDAKVQAEDKLVAAAAGRFVPGRSIDVAVVGSAGTVALLDGRTGAVLGSHSLGIEPVGAPTTFPGDWNDPNSVETAVFLASNGTLKALLFNSDGTAVESASIALDGVFGDPPAVGTLGCSVPAPHLIAVSRRGQLAVASARDLSARPLSLKLPSEIPYEGSRAAVGDVDGDGTDDVVVLDDQGFLSAFSVVDSEVRRVWPAVSVGRVVGRQALADANGDGKADILVPKDDRQMFLVDGATGSRDAIWKSPYSHDGTYASPPSLAAAADGRAWAVFGDSASRVDALDLRTRGLASPEARASIGAPFQGEALVGRFSEAETLQAFVVAAQDGAVHLVDLGIPAGAGSWRGSGGGPWRTASLSPAFEAYSLARRESLRANFESVLAEAEAAAAKGEWKVALAKADEALALSPFDEAALALRGRVWLRSNLILVALGAIAAAGGLGAGGWWASRIVLRDLRVKKVKERLARDDTQGAAELMKTIYKSSSGNASHLKTMVELYLTLERYDAESAEAFEKAVAAFPSEPLYATALAKCHLATGRRDDAAGAAFERMLRGTEPAGPWAYALGECHANAGRDEAALKSFRLAAAEGFRSPDLDLRLADLYVKLKIARSDVLETLRAALPKRLEDADFLRTYCESTQVARIYDEDAHTAAERLLKFDPASPEAHLILSSRALQMGMVKESMRHAEAILERDPNDSIGLRLLGACYAAENRLDGTAMQIFQRALRANPEANEILLAVGKGYIQQGRDDSEAEEIYRRALQGNPEDQTLLEVVCDLAAKKADDRTVIETGERLLAKGLQSRKLVLQLADAYCRRGRVDDQAEPVYREALTHVPDHATVALNLATIYARRGRNDAEALQVYLKVYERDPSRREIARRLAFAYQAAEMGEKALALARKLLDESPDDDALKKLAAGAAASLDQMDSAIQGYEQVLRNNPDDGEALSQLALLYARKRVATPAALEIYRRAARAQPTDREIHAALARAWAERQDWDQVVATIKHLLSHAPTQIGAAIAAMEEICDRAPGPVGPLRWFMVDTMIFDGRLADAAKQLVELARNEPESVDRVLEGFDKILDKNPRDATAHHQRGRILLGLKRFSEARLALEMAHRNRPQDERVAHDLMDLYEGLLERADSAEVRFQLGKLAMRFQKNDLAISCFQKTAKDFRWENSSVKLLAQCFMAKGMLDLALQELRRLAVDEETKELLYELGQRYQAVADAKGAREVYKSIFAVDIGYRDVKGKLESLDSSQPELLKAERTAIINSLPEQAKSRYELIEELGRGAMGIVYRAHDTELDEVVALKILPETLGNNAEALRRFRTEARNARHLSHPNIVRIHDIGEEQGRKYISMEFVDGINLKERMIELNRKLPFAETLSYSRQIAAAMIAAHDAGIVHRDIKPANIMIARDGKVKIADFGIAKAIQDDAAEASRETTKVGAIVGTPLYMSPEQVQGTGADYRSDIYSLGIVLYEMVAGLPPFYEGDLAYHHVFSEPPPLTNADEEFAAIVLRCLAKKAENRWQNCREIFDALKRFKA